MLPFKVKRSEETIKSAIAEIIQREIKDPRIGFITVSGVHLSKDIKKATVYVSVLGNEKQVRESIDILQSARFFLRKLLRQKIVMKFIPELSFSADSSLEYAFHIEKILKDIKSNSIPNKSSE